MTEPAASAARRGSEPPEDRSALPRDDSRAWMMRQEEQLSVDQRIALFDALSRDANWARGAVRLR